MKRCPSVLSGLRPHPAPMAFCYFGHYGQSEANAFNRFICLTPPKGRKNPFIISFSYASTVVTYGKSVEFFRFFIANFNLA